MSSGIPSSNKSPEKAMQFYNYQDSDRAMGGPLGGPVSGPGPMDLQNAVSSDEGEELSYYAIDNITSISDLVQLQNLLQY